MPTPRGARELLARAAAVCRASISAKGLREELVGALRGVVPFDAYNFPLTDPVTRVGTSPLADVPGLTWEVLPALIRARYLTRECRWDRLAEAGIAATSLLRETGGEPDRSLLWREVQHGLGVSDTAVTVFADRYGCWGLLDLWRCGGPPFAAAELDLLAALAPVVAEGLRAAVARTFVDPEPDARPSGPAVLLLDEDMRVHAQTEAAGAALLRLNPPDEPMAPIPAAAYNIAAALIAFEEQIPVGPPWSRIHLGGGRWVTVKASRINRDIAVSIEPSAAGERVDLYARTHALSGRESQVLLLLCEGLSTREIARRIAISEHTAGDHLKAILGKTLTGSRQVLLARALGAPGTTGPHDGRGPG